MTEASTPTQLITDATTVTHQELVIIDPTIPNYQPVLEDLKASQRTDTQLEVMLLDPLRDGIEQISETLASHQHLDAVHIVSHGQAGSLRLGSTQLTFASLGHYAELIGSWRNSLSANADLLLYGCDLAASETGRGLVQGLANLTGADVAVSIDKTGNARFNADWELEYRIGNIETSVVFDPLLQQDWQGLLAPLTVTTTADTLDGNTTSIANLIANPGADGHISLREAIIAANNTANSGTPDRVGFSIPAPLVDGAHTILLTSALPTISDPVIIDGTSEPDFSGTPIIELNGAIAGSSASGFTLGAGSSGSTIRGLVINRFGGNLIHLSSSDNNVIVGNYLGTDVSGTVDRGGGDSGVLLDDGASGNRIGGTTAADRNLISGNGYAGINITGLGTDNNLVEGNGIGVDAAGTGALGNTAFGVVIWDGPKGNQIGGVVAGSGNLIGYNYRGVIVDANFVAAVNNPILGNSIFANNATGIDLYPTGVTANDTGDGDTGPNNYQNYPVLSTASTDGTQINLSGTFNSTANANFRLEFFASSAQDETQYGEGETYLGYLNLTTDGSGNASFNTTLTASVAAIANTAPVITSNGGAASASIQIAENTTAVTTVTATDPEVPPQTLSYSLVGGVDAAKFTINNSTGALTFNTAPDFETPADADTNNVYEVSVQVSDGNGGIDTQALSVTVTDIARALVVTTTADSLDGDSSSAEALNANPGADGLISLREAIIAANNTPGADEITLPTAIYQLSLAGTDEDAALTGDLDITEDLTISGAGATATVVDANGLDRVFDVHGGIVKFTDLTLQGGSLTVGGGIQIRSGADLTLTTVRVNQNVADVGAGIFNDGNLSAFDTEISANGDASTSTGGGIRNEGFANLVNVCISGNRADTGAGIDNRQHSADLSLTNVTISGNTAQSVGGGLYTNQLVWATNVTIAFNAASSGGGICTSGGSDLNISNSIVAFNSGGNSNQAVTSSGHNIDSENSLGLGQTGDQINTDPRLGPLKDNGGPTQTHALLLSSPAIDAGTTAGAPATDQRGVPRGAMPDIGAYEFVVGANQAPTTNDVTAGGNEDAPAIAITLSGSDADGTVQSFRLNDLPANGTLYSDATLTSLAAVAVDYGASSDELTLYFVPTANWNGTTNFQYLATDDLGETDPTPATATITVTAENDAPSLTSTPVTSANEEALYSYSITTTDPDSGDTLTITASTLPAWLTLTDNGDGTATLTGTPSSAEVGNHSVVLELSDGTATVTQSFTIAVANVNDAPTITNQTFQVDENSTTGTVVGTVLASDPDGGDTLSYAITAGNTTNAFRINAATGQITVNNSTALDFETNPMFSLTVRVTDNGTPALSDTATVTINLNNLLDTNQAPVAKNDSYSLTQDTVLTVTGPGILGNDADPNHDPLTAVVVSGPSHGSLMLNPNGSFTYRPAVNFHGSDGFSYKASDGQGGEAMAVVLLNVTPQSSADDGGQTPNTPSPGESAGGKNGNTPGEPANSDPNDSTPPPGTVDVDQGNNTATAATDNSAQHGSTPTDEVRDNSQGSSPTTGNGRASDNTAANDNSTVGQNSGGRGKNTGSTAPGVQGPLSRPTVNNYNSGGTPVSADSSGIAVTSVTPIGKFSYSNYTLDPGSPLEIGSRSHRPAVSAGTQDTGVRKLRADHAGSSSDPGGNETSTPGQGTPPADVQEPLTQEDGGDTAQSESTATAPSPRADSTEAPPVAEVQQAPAGNSTETLASVLRADGFVRDMDQLREAMRQQTHLEKAIVASTIATATGLSIGYVVWIVRGGLLISSVLSSLPAWRLVDPLPVLAYLRRQEGKRGEDDSDFVESLFGKLANFLKLRRTAVEALDHGSSHTPTLEGLPPEGTSRTTEDIAECKR